MTLDPSDYDVAYWTPPKKLTVHEYRDWLAERLAEFAQAVAGGIHTSPTLNTEAIARVVDSVKGGLATHSGNPSKAILEAGLVERALREEGDRVHGN